MRSSALWEKEGRYTSLPDIRSIYALIRYAMDSGSINFKSANRMLGRGVDDYHTAIDLALLVCLGIVEPAENWQKIHYTKEDAKRIESKLSTMLRSGQGDSWKSSAGEFLLDIFILNIVVSDVGWVDITAMNKLFHDATKLGSNAG